MNDTTIRIVVCGVTGTSLMTLFSYTLSLITKRNFREPELLNELLMRSHILHYGRKFNVLGWIIHYVVGLLFITLFEGVADSFFRSPAIGHYLIAGLLFGIAGMLGWMIVFALHINPPKVDRVAFYMQIVIAHVVFGAGAYLGYLLVYQPPKGIPMCCATC